MTTSRTISWRCAKPWLLSMRITRARRGMTLVELLMVVVILALLMVVAVPMVRPAFRDRKVREAARQINAFFTAQARAAEMGRPVGVWIERFDNSEIGSRFSVGSIWPRSRPPLRGRPGVRSVQVRPGRQTGVFRRVESAILRTIVAPGERFTIKFDYKGHEYVGERVGAVFRIAIPSGDPSGGRGRGSRDFPTRSLGDRSVRPSRP